MNHTRLVALSRMLAPPFEIGGALLVIPYLVISAGGDLTPLSLTLNWLSWSLLVVALGLRRILAPSWRTWARSQWLGIAVVVISVPVTQAPALHALRLVRLVPLVRLAGPAQKLTVLLASRGGIAGLGALAALTVILGGVVFGAVEPTVAVGSWDGIWWAIQTATTVGYGDVVPTNNAGRVVGGVIMLLGVGLVASFTAALASVITRVGQDQPAREGEGSQALLERLDRLEQHLSRLGVDPKEVRRSEASSSNQNAEGDPRRRESS